MSAVREDKKQRLESAGWRVGDTAEFLELTPEEAAFIELKLALAVYLRDVRTSNGWTQTEVARRLGSSQSRVAKMEAADATVSLDLLFKSLLALGVMPHTVGSDNVFADLGLARADEHLAKAALAREIAGVITRRRLTQTQAARVLGATQPKVSDVVAGRLAGFSMERLIRFLNALDRDVEIRVSPKPRGRERATLHVVGP